MTVLSSSATDSVPRSGAVAVGLAVAAAVVIFLLAHVFGVELAIPAQPGSTTLEPMPLTVAIGFTVVAAVAATVFAWLLRRVAPTRATPVFTVTAVAIMLLSLVPVVTTGLATADVVALTVMHLGVGMAILVPLRRGLQTA